MAFDGHGDERTGDNRAFLDLVQTLQQSEAVTKSFLFHSGIGLFPVKKACAEVLRYYRQFSDSNLLEHIFPPTIWLMGYSSGAVDGLSFIQQLHKLEPSINIDRWLTFDPRSPIRPPLMGAQSYHVPLAIPTLNFYQRSGFKWRINPFHGARLHGCQVTNINLTHVAGHNDIVRRVCHWYPHLILKAH